jgi:hypothetical protein
VKNVRRQIAGSADERAIADGASHDVRSPDARRTGLILLAFVALVVLTALLHEPWFDEWQAWLIARDSSSLGDVLHNSRYEGHPPLWYLALWLVSRVSRDILAMQLLNVAVATATAAVILWRAPFPLLVRTALIFGYLPFYEYGTIARSYGLGLLLLVLVCTEAARPSRRPLLLAALLALMILTSAHTMIVALALVAALLVDEALVRRIGHDGVRPARELVLAAVIIGLSLVWSVAQILPPSDSGFGVGLDTPAEVRSGLPPFDQVTAIAVIGRRAIPPQPIAYALGVGIVTLLAWRVRRRPAALTLVLAGIGMLLAVAALRFTGSLRHFGHLYMVGLAALWLEHSFVTLTREPSEREVSRRVFSWFVVLVLSAHVAFGARAAVKDWFSPYTPAPEAATWLEQRDLANAPILGYPDFRVAGVGGTLDRSILFLNDDRVGTFVLWQNGRREVTTDDVVEAARSTLESADQVVVLTNEPLTGDLGPLSLEASFTDGVIPEWVFVYVGGEPVGDT